MASEEIRLRQMKAAQAIHFTHFAFMEVLQEIRRSGREAEDNFRDGTRPLGIIKYQIHSGPLVDHEEGQRHFHKGPQNIVQGTWQKLGPVYPALQHSLFVGPSQS